MKLKIQEKGYLHKNLERLTLDNDMLFDWNKYEE